MAEPAIQRQADDSVHVAVAAIRKEAVSTFLSALVNGLATGVPLFLVSSGLTLIFGVMNVLNFAHGAFFMVGAYVFATLLAGHATPLPLFFAAAVTAAAAVAVVGIVSERLVFARLYRQGHIINLLAAYAIMLILIGAAILIWGTQGHTVQRPAGLDGALNLGFVRLPYYNLLVIALGAIVAVGLWLLLAKTPLGVQIRAVAHDRTTARALGVRAPLVGMGVFVLGGALAGFAGALDAPLISVAPGLDSVFAIQCFAIIIIGGLGSIEGAFVASLAVGIVESFLTFYGPVWEPYGMYILVAAVLLLRPQGLFGRAQPSH